MQGAPYLLGIEANWEHRADANIAWARGPFDAMQTCSNGGVNLDFPGYDEDSGGLVSAADGPNAERLRTIKAVYDSDGVFPGLLGRPC